jgi:hypothetical protein
MMAKLDSQIEKKKGGLSKKDGGHGFEGESRSNNGLRRCMRRSLWKRLQ